MAVTPANFSCPHVLDAEWAGAVLGEADAHVHKLEELCDVRIFARGHEATITGSAAGVTQCVSILQELEAMARRGHPITPDTVEHVAGMVESTRTRPLSAADTAHRDIVLRRGKIIRPKTKGQQEYCAAIDSNTVIFGIGPAGSGKTYLAVAKAVQALNQKQVSRIILTRPAVEAGEKLGFLPGTLTEKIDPYLRPLYDALRDSLEPELIPKLLEAGVIEVAPLAYMRGRTLSDAFVILDEAQNTTTAQMKMFLTRLGKGSKMVVTGDITQVDLPGGARSGLRMVRKILRGVEDVAFCELSAADVVRHRVVAAIVSAYNRWEESTSTSQDARPRTSRPQEAQPDSVD